MARLPRRRRVGVPSAASEETGAPVEFETRRAYSEPPPADVDEILAAATRLDLDPDPNRFRAKRNEEWKEDAWRLYETVGEITQYGNFYGNSLSTIEFKVGDEFGNELIDVVDRPPEFDLPQAVLSQAQIDDARDRMSRLVGYDGTQASLSRPLGIVLAITSDATVVGYPINEDGSAFLESTGGFDSPGEPQKGEDNDGTGERFVVVPSENADHKKHEVQLSRSGSKDRVHPRSMFLRIYQAHPAYPRDAFSPVCAVIECADDLQILSRAQSNAALSRAHAGFLTWPQELLARQPGPVGQRKPGDDDLRNIHPTLKALAEGWLSAANDPTSEDIVVPGIVSGPKDALDAIRHIQPDRLLDPSVGEAILGRQKRLAQTLPIPPEVILGISESAAFNAWKVTEDTYTHYIQPAADLVADAFTDGYLWPSSAESSLWDSESLRIIRVMADATKLVVRTDMGEAANDAHDRMEISGETYRRVKGFTEADAPSVEEIAERRLNGLARRGSGGGGGALPRPMGGPGAGGVNDSTMASLDEITASAMASTDKDLTDLSSELLKIDREFRLALEQIIESTIERTVDRRGAQLRSLIIRDKARPELAQMTANALTTDIARLIGRDETERVLALARKPIDDVAEFTAMLRSRFDKLAEQAKRKLSALYKSRLGRPMTAEETRRFLERQAASWSRLIQDTRESVEARLFGIGPTEGEVGSVSRNATRTARRAAAELGGQTVEGTVVGNPGAGEPLAPGPSLGPDGLDSLEDRGVVAEDEYLWLYGDPATRGAPFPPHERLDSGRTGTRYLGYEDPKLAIQGTFPRGSHYRPDDHAGCGCDFVPVFGFATTPSQFSPLATT